MDWIFNKMDLEWIGLEQKWTRSRKLDFLLTPIFRIWGSKPMSNILSTSSSSSCETCLKSIFFISSISLSGLGVKTTMSVPRSNSFSWRALIQCLHHKCSVESGLRVIVIRGCSSICKIMSSSHLANKRRFVGDN